MLRTTNFTGLSIILQLSIDGTDKDEVDESGDKKTNLSNLSLSKKSTRAGFLTSKGTKKGSGNIKNGVKAARGFDYLTPDIKKAFNHLQHMFTQVPIFQYCDLKRYIQIETDALGYAIRKDLSQLTFDNLG